MKNLIEVKLDGIGTIYADAKGLEALEVLCARASLRCYDEADREEAKVQPYMADSWRQKANEYHDYMMAIEEALK